MTRQPERIDSVCQQNSSLYKLSQRARFLAELNHILQQTLPTQFSAHCRLANIKDETLIIHTDNASYASLIRFQAPVLCKTLSTELNITIRNLEVKVRPFYIPLQNSHKNTLSLPRTAAETIQHTAQSIEDGPLKTALEKLAKRCN
ncbi:MAG: hypothetical protein DRQ40_03615 [Gammaproteobacteria bacterium]|nr:MAG: hypothetical protein DRQ40_03615 [Gammaproteobacteria bacterium]RKZ97022.1 MAG: hypothetical protein DRQ46_06010 [Gammaproteobacteria bacterium]RLA02186.1 MAG: hypothetical protein DRQ42_01320 [Gammaproteobacteria bacterium]